MTTSRRIAATGSLVTSSRRREKITAVPLLELLLSGVQPHPELVAATRPSPRQVTEVASLLGWLAEDEDRFRPAAVG
jgi:hypothetical protein